MELAKQRNIYDMEKSNYAKYLESRGDIHIIEDEHGFVTYKYEEDYVYIIDVYINPDSRKQGLASKYGDRVAEIAAERGCTEMVGSVDMDIENPKRSIEFLFAYGFKPWFCNNNGIYLKKSINIGDTNE